MSPLPDNIGSFSKPVQQLWSRMNPCILCPRNCKVHRSKGETGFCGITDIAVVSSAGPHFGEETVLVGAGGSGAIFFAGCNLGCIFCQNFEISHNRRGHRVSIEQLASSMLELQDKHCSNINLVTPTHVVPMAMAAVETAKGKGLTLPIVYNSGGYDSVETLKLLEGFVDIYMPDMKYSTPAISRELASSPNYPLVSRAAIKEMHRQVGELVIEKGIARRGLLVRHLVLPNRLAGSSNIIDFLAEQISPTAAINIMDQYRPCYRAFFNDKLKRLPLRQEIEEVFSYAKEKGLRIIS